MGRKKSLPSFSLARFAARPRIQESRPYVGAKNVDLDTVGELENRGTKGEEATVKEGSEDGREEGKGHGTDPFLSRLGRDRLLLPHHLGFRVSGWTRPSSFLDRPDRSLEVSRARREGGLEERKLTSSFRSLPPFLPSSFGPISAASITCTSWILSGTFPLSERCFLGRRSSPFPPLLACFLVRPSSLLLRPSSLVPIPLVPNSQVIQRGCRSTRQA